MATTLSNKRFQFHAETKKEGGNIKLSGEATVNEDGTVQSFSGQVQPIDQAPNMITEYGSFSYSLMNGNASQNINVPNEYREEACQLLTIGLQEIKEKVTNI